MTTGNRGMYFEEFKVGDTFTTVGRTVTETDVVTFAGLSGDYTQIHTDAEFSHSTPFGQRIAHGLLGLSIASGLAVRSGILESTVIAFREVKNWKFVKPVFIGDTIHVELEVKETKAMPKLGGGLVVIALKVQNQHGEPVMRGMWSTLIASQPE